jgi:hypothetical protein
VKSLLIILLSSFCCLWATAASYAGPVTFRFEATVHSVERNLSFDSGIDVAIGDVITGQFTFNPAIKDPADLWHAVVQPYQAVLNIDGHQFQTPNSKRDLTLTSLNQASVIDFTPEFEGLVDGLWVQGSLAPLDSSTFPNISFGRNSFSLEVYGDTSVLDSFRFPQDSTTWNAFTFFRGIVVSISPDFGNGETFYATIGSFVTVPEPPPYGMGLTAPIIWIVARGKKRRQVQI